MLIKNGEFYITWGFQLISSRTEAADIEAESMTTWLARHISLFLYIFFISIFIFIYLSGAYIFLKFIPPLKKKQKNMQNYNRLIFYNKYLFNTKQQDLFCSTLIDTSAMNLPDGLLEINLFCIVPFYSIFNICGKTTKKKLP